MGDFIMKHLTVILSSLYSTLLVLILLFCHYEATNTDTYNIEMKIDNIQMIQKETKDMIKDIDSYQSQFTAMVTDEVTHQQ